MKTLKLGNNFSLVVALISFSLSLVLIGLAPKLAEAQTLFRDDFESGKVDWTGTGKKTTLVIVDHAKSKRLMQQANGGDAVGNAIPNAIKDKKDLTDYTVEAEITFDDDDQWGLVFRYADEDNWYVYEVDQNDCHQAGKEAAAEWRIKKRKGGGDPVVIAKGPAPCPSKDSPDIGDDLKAPVSTDIHKYKVTVKGNSITAFMDDKKLGEATDADHPKGTAGIRYDTIVGTVDNFHVYGPAGPGGGVAVEAKGKLTETWGRLKNR